MAEQNSGLEPDTSAVGGPNGVAGTEDGGWQGRYEHLQPEYTRATQERDQFRSERDEALERNQWFELLVTSDDPDIRSQAAEILGFELGEEQEEYPVTGQEPDPFAAYETRLAALEERQSQAQAQEAEAEHARIVREVLDERIAELGLDEEDGNLVLSYAMEALEPTEEGLPDVQAAYEFLQARDTAKQKAWADQKRQAPVFPPAGQEGVEAPNLDNDQERQAYMAARLQAGQQI